MLVWLMLACSGGGDSAKGDSTAGADVYDANCASCHGADGTAGVEIGGEPAADLTFEATDLSEDEIISVILNGEGTMPPVAITEQEAADCAAYVIETFGG